MHKRSLLLQSLLGSVAGQQKEYVGEHLPQAV